MAAYSKPRSFMSMLLTVFVLLQVSVALSHNGHMHPAHRSREAMEEHFQDTRSMLVARAGQINVQGATNGQHPRLDIRELQKNADQWNLYLIAMERFMGKPREDPMSYYQLAGIHGRPFVQWNNQGLKHSAGYCPHGQNTFGSWHRPYLAIFEVRSPQCMLKIMTDNPLASPSPQRTRGSRILPQSPASPLGEGLGGSPPSLL